MFGYGCYKLNSRKIWISVRVDNTDISLLVNIMVISMENDISAKTGQY